MMHQPFTRERFTGDSNSARYRGPAGERALHVRRCARARRRDADDDQPAADEGGGPRSLRQGRAAAKLSRYGGDCYAYCMLAAGHVDLVIETELKPYDILPLMPIIAGAGGIVTAWDGGSPKAGGRIIARRRHARCTKRCDGRLRQRRRLRIRDLFEQRRARHEGVERRPELRAIAVLLHHEFVPGAGDDQVRAGAQPHGDVLDRRRWTPPGRGRRRPACSGWRILLA